MSDPAEIIDPVDPVAPAIDPTFVPSLPVVNVQDTTIYPYQGPASAAGSLNVH